MPTSKIITLRRPVTVGKGDKAKVFDSFELVEPTAGQYEQAERLSAEVGLYVALTAIVANVPVDAVDLSGVSVTTEAIAFFDQFADSAGDPPASDEDWTLELQEPLELRDTKSDTVEMSFSSLNLSEPTNLQRRKAASAGGPYAQAIALLSSNSTVPKAALRKLPASAFLVACKYLNGFQERRRASADA